MFLSASTYDPTALPLDTSFGNGGTVSGYSGPMLVQSDGRILVDQGGTGHLVRLNPNGSPDLTFNSAAAVDNWGPNYAAQSDGKHLVLNNGAITRYNADGSIDTTFGSGGSVSTFYVNPAYRGFTPQAIALQGDKVVVAGRVAPDPNLVGDQGKGPYGVERLNPDGSQDVAYGMHVYDDSYFDPATVRRVRVNSDGHILVVGDDTEPHMDLIDFGADGPDGSTGVMHRLGEGYVTDMAFAPDGKIVVVGYSGIYFREAWLARLNPDLSFDQSFSMGAATFIGVHQPPSDYTAPTPQPNGLAVAPDGNILVSFADNSIMEYLGTGLHTGGWIQCTGFEDANGNGVQDPGERGDSSGAVYLDLNNNGQLDPGEPTAPGSTFVNLPPGTYRVRQSVGYGVRQTVPSSGYYDVTVAAGQTVSGLVFATQDVKTHVSGQLKPAFHSDLPWTIYADANGNGQLDPGEISTQTNTGADLFGTWSMELAPGSYIIRVQPNPGYAQQSPPNDAGYSITLPVPKVERGNDGLPGTYGDDFVFASTTPLPTTGTVLGTVFVDVNGDGQPDAGDDYLSGAVIYLDQNDNGKLDPGEPSATSGSDGSYTLAIPSNTSGILRANFPPGYVGPTNLPPGDSRALNFPEELGAGQSERINPMAVPAASSSPQPTTTPPSTGSDPTQAVVTDRIALQTARASYAHSVVDQTRQIRADRKALAAALRTLRRAQAQARHAGTAVDPSLPAEVDSLRAQLLADQQSLKTLRQTGMAEINAARKNLIASQRSLKAARRR